MWRPENDYRVVDMQNNFRAAKGTPPFHEGTQLICKNSNKNGKDHFAHVYIMIQTPQTILTKKKGTPPPSLNHKATLRLASVDRFLRIDIIRQRGFDNFFKSELVSTI
ncbi:hypothetical protein Scep_025548 [Stephania cephalantha]|uniref:Uncharacterized protein n=1 Tax=Stephania cephalantha TaxID=152367 RepID=A0AAP0HPG4_9MAGN